MEVATTPAPMAVTLDATLSGATSNSYLTMATALQIAESVPGGGDWVLKTEDARNLSLIQATRWLETIDYDGTRCKASQRLKWPRSGATCDGVTSDCSGIPYQLQEAEVMLAIQYDQNPGSFPGTDSGGTTQTGTYVAEQTLGDLSIKYNAYPAGQTDTNHCSSCNDPIIIQKFPWLESLLRCWMSGASGNGTRVIARVRS